MLVSEELAPSPAGGSRGALKTTAVFTEAGKLAPHLPFGLSTSIASKSQKRQCFNSTGRTGQQYLTGDTWSPLPPLQPELGHPAGRHQREEEAQIGALSVLLVSIIVFRPKSQSRNCLALCISYIGTLRCNHKTDTHAAHADRLGSGGSTVHLEI